MPARKTSEILREAKKHLIGPDLDRVSKTTMVCYAIGRATGNTSRELRTMHQVRERIRLSLAPYATVDSWLHKVHGVPMRLLESPRTGQYTRAMQEYRHRWLDALINEYAAKGD